MTARKEWIKLQLSDTVLKFLDGINIDYEDAIDPFTPEQYGFTSLVKETAEAFHSLPGLEVSFMYICFSFFLSFFFSKGERPWANTIFLIIIIFKLPNLHTRAQIQNKGPAQNTKVLERR